MPMCSVGRSRPRAALFITTCLIAVAVAAIGSGRGAATDPPDRRPEAGPASKPEWEGTDALYLFHLGSVQGDRKNRHQYVLVDRHGTIVVDHMVWRGLGKPTEGRIPFESEESTNQGYPLLGYLDTTGKVVIPPTFLEAHNFSDGLAYVLDGERNVGFIDPTGRVVIPFDRPRRGASRSFDSAYGFHEGLAVGIIRGPNFQDKCGYIDKSGQWAIPPKFDGAFNFSEGLAVVAFQTGERYFIDRRGEIALRPPAGLYVGGESGGDFHSGLAMVQNKDGKCGFMDRTGEVVIPLTYEKQNICQFSGNFAAFSQGFRGDRLWGFIDTKGKVVIPPRFTRTQETYGNPFAPQRNPDSFQWVAGACRVTLPGGKQGLIDTSAHVIWQQP